MINHPIFSKDIDMVNYIGNKNG